jgi:hypothetical protein
VTDNEKERTVVRKKPLRLPNKRVRPKPVQRLSLLMVKGRRRTPQLE